MSIVAWATIIAGLWAIINGLLHDIFVLRSEQGKTYDRNLLRLLMDGHILITCGAIEAIAYKGIGSTSQWGYYISAIAALSLFIYCIMIWPFLKSIGTMAVNLVLLGLLAAGYFHLL